MSLILNESSINKNEWNSFLAPITIFTVFSARKINRKNDDSNRTFKEIRTQK